jgi:enoyl-CoA hydratase/carnithine racemase
MDILLNDRQRVRHLTLNRPNKRNALTLEMCTQIVEAVRSAQSRSDIGCVLISAAGSVFCSGMDLSESAPVEAALKVHEQLFTLGAQSLKPIVIAVNGAALAGGLGLVAQGHVVISSPNAVFALPELRIGFWPFIIYRSIEAALGKRCTLQLSLTGDNFDAQQGLAWGLVHRICSVDELEATSWNTAREIAESSPLAVALGMQYVRDAEGKSATEAGEIAASLRAKLTASADFAEGTAARKQKRKPFWPSMPLDFYANRPSSGDDKSSADNS